MLKSNATVADARGGNPPTTVPAMCCGRRVTLALFTASVFAAVVVAGCSGGASDAIVDCELRAQVQPFCGFSNPEDLTFFAPTGDVLVSQFGSMDGRHPGSLVRFHPDTIADGLKSTPLYPGAGLDHPEPGWGDAACPGPPGSAFAPHGLDLIERADGRHALLVVNHGGRESVEFFEAAGGHGGAVLTWRGCVVMPESSYPNDVVALGDGGFWATHMYPRDAELSSVVKALFGTDTGWVIEWRPRTGFAELPGTRAPMPNGIARSVDERYLYLNAYLGNEVRRIEVDSGTLLAVAKVSGPDNSTWAADGRLLVASHHGGLRQALACRGMEQGSCRLRSSIVALDPDDLSATVLLDGEDLPIGAVSVALEVNAALWLGTFAGDRVARFRPAPRYGSELPQPFQ